VIGSGTMGAGIAEVAAAAGHPVLFTTSPPRRFPARSTVFVSVWPPACARQTGADQADALLARLASGDDLAALPTPAGD
jgi:3-hydroxybutyryl-CoA dehydrogenase